MDVGSPWPRRRRSSLTTTAPLLRKPPCKAWVDRTGCSCIPSSYFSCFLLLSYSTYTALTPPSPPQRRRHSPFRYDDDAPLRRALPLSPPPAVVVVSLDRPKMESSSRKPSCPSFSFNCTKTRRGKSILQLAACSFF